MKKLLQIMLVSILCFSCTKDNVVHQPTTQVLPPITQEGRNSFGCLLNGNVWIPNCKNFPNRFSSAPLYAHYDNSGLFSFHADGGADTINHHFSFNQYLFSPSQIELNSDSSGMVFVLSNTINDPHYYYWNDSLRKGILKVTKLDIENKIIAGTFYFDAIDTTRNQVIHITEGRFDFKYN